MKKAQILAGAALGILLLTSALGHLLVPELSDGLIPDGLPKMPVHLVTAVAEAALGVGVFFPSVRRRALFGIFLLMIAFLPLHIADLCRENPAIGSKAAAITRIPLQFLLIYLAWFSRRLPAKAPPAT